MVTALNPFETQADKDDEDQPQPGSPPTPPSSGSSQPATIGAGAPAPASSVPATTQRVGSGRYNNLSGFIKANKDFNQGQGLGGKIVSNVQQSANQQGQKLQQTQQQFGQQAAQAAQPFAGQAQPGQLINPNAVQSAQQQAQQALQNATSTAADPEAAKKFAQLRDAQYTGPKALEQVEGGAALSAGAQNLQSTAKQAQSDSGRYNLLRQMFGNTGYTRGQQTLDNLLVSSDRNQVRALQGTRGIASSAQKQLQDASARATGTGQALANQADTIKQATRSALGQTVTGFDSDLMKKAEDAQTARDTNQSTAKTLLNQGYLDEKALEQSGLAGTNIYNIDNLGDYLVQNQNRATKQTVASAEDYARAQALRSLSGQYETPELSKVFQDYTQADQAGKFASEADYSIDKDRLNRAILDKKLEFEGQAADPLAKTKEAESALRGDLYAKGGLEKALQDSFEQRYAGLNQDAYKQYIDVVRRMAPSNSPTRNLFRQSDVAGQIKNLGTEVRAGRITEQQFNNQVYELAKSQFGNVSQLSGDALSTQLDRQFGLQPVVANQVLSTRLSFERAKEKENQAKYKALQDLFKVNRTLQVRPENMVAGPVDSRKGTRGVDSDGNPV